MVVVNAVERQAEEGDLKASTVDWLAFVSGNQQS